MPKICYFCGERATSKEHVPPKNMTREVQCDRITVPACDKHNTDKSNADQAVVSAFLQSLDLWKSYNAVPYDSNVETAIEAGSSSFERTKANVVRARVLAEPFARSSLIEDAFFISPTVKVEEWIRLITAGLAYDAWSHFDPRIRWADSHVFGARWLRTDSLGPTTRDKVRAQVESSIKLLEVLENLKWEDGWSAVPRPYPKAIYHFRFSVDDDLVRFKHVFYQQIEAYVLINVPSELAEELEAAFTQRVKRSQQFNG